MESVGKFILLAGFLMMIGSQFYIAVIAFKRNLIDGLFCIIIPAYILYFAMRQETRQNKVLIIWGAGIVLIILSTFMLTTF
jgi:hypothetical protein